MDKRDASDHTINLGHSKNGKRVWYDSVLSHAATHFKDTSNLDALVLEVIRDTELKDSYAQFHTDLGRIVGVSDLVIIDDGDEIIYAKRLKMKMY